MTAQDLEPKACAASATDAAIFVLGVSHLNVTFAKSLVRVPFRIPTADEEKLLSKNDKDIRKQVQEAFSPTNKK